MKPTQRPGTLFVERKCGMNQTRVDTVAARAGLFVIDGALDGRVHGLADGFSDRLRPAAGQRPPMARPTPSLRPRRIIAAVDFSPAGERARRVAAALAHAGDVVLDLVHVLDAFDQIFVRRQPQLLEQTEAVLEGIEVALRSRVAAARQEGVRCVSSSLVGAPGIELTRHAERTGADLMVIGGSTTAHDPLAPAWGARALEQILRLSRWTGVIVRVRP
jgi:nucleotide-binding universal stress UspA family protein